MSLKKIEFIGKKTGRKIFRFEMSEAFYRDRAFGLDNPGYCVFCGSDSDGVEPDARKYEWESGGRKGVYGLEELLVMGFVGIIP